MNSNSDPSTNPTPPAVRLPSGLLAHLKTGETPTVEHFNAIVDDATAAALRHGLPPIASVRLENDATIDVERWNTLASDLETISEHINQKRPPSPATLFIKLTESNGKGQYAWREQIAQSEGAWVDGPAHGTFDSWPACEMNGNGTLKPGTIVVASRSQNCDQLIFQMAS